MEKDGEREKKKMGVGSRKKGQISTKWDFIFFRMSETA